MTGPIDLQMTVVNRPVKLADDSAVGRQEGHVLNPAVPIKGTDLALAARRKVRSGSDEARSTVATTT